MATQTQYIPNEIKLKNKSFVVDRENYIGNIACAMREIKRMRLNNNDKDVIFRRYLGIIITYRRIK